MLELVFVIVVLGILAAIALPKFAATRTDAMIAKARSDVAAIRSGIINERQTRIIKGDTTYIDPSKLNTSDGLFAGVLTYGIKDSSNEGHWHKTNNTTYTFKVGDTSVTFKYDKSKGTFTCKGHNSGQAATYCSDIVD